MAGQKKGAKVGRNAKRCAAYRSARRREINKVKRLLRHMRREPSDMCAVQAFDALSMYHKEARRELMATGFKQRPQLEAA